MSNKKLRVWYMDRLPANKTTHIDVKSVDEAKSILGALVKRDLNDDRVTDNTMGLEEFDGKEWSEYYNEDGQDIDEIMSESVEEMTQEVENKKKEEEAKRNYQNKLNLKQKSNLLIVELKENITVAIPVAKKLSNASVLDIYEDGMFTAHWHGNWNTDGDFSSELMRFDNDLVMDTMDFKKRNEFRVKNGLLPIE